MAEKKTVMVLNVDLQCPCCYKKIQKILCRIPQISDRIFDQKTNTVLITVICCSPEKIRDKLICKGGKIIKSIEIKEPPKAPKPDDKPKAKDDKPKDDKPKDDKPKPNPAEQKPKEAEKQKETEKPKTAEKPKSNGKGNAPPPAAAEKPKDTPKPEPTKTPAPVPAPAPAPAPIPVGLPPVNPVNPCCGPCYEGYGGGPCYHGYGFPPPPPQPCYDGNYGPGYVYGKPCYVTRCDYFSEENSTGCAIM